MTIRELFDVSPNLSYLNIIIENPNHEVYKSMQDGKRVNGYDEYIKPYIPDSILDREVKYFDIYSDNNSDFRYFSIMTPEYVYDEQYNPNKKIIEFNVFNI